MTVRKCLGPKKCAIQYHALPDKGSAVEDLDVCRAFDYAHHIKIRSKMQENNTPCDVSCPYRLSQASIH